MDAWELDFAYLRVQHIVRQAMRKEALPDLNALLLIIGIQELGRWKKTWSKEEKQDLMHIAMCRLLSYDGYYTFAGRDADGWPHWLQTRQLDTLSLKSQENLLKTYIVRYFQELEAENGGFNV